jgi:hypothetical protein
VFDALPADALACNAQATEVSCWRWRERRLEDAEKAVDSLHAVLAKLAEVQRVADEAKQRARTRTIAAREAHPTTGERPAAPFSAKLTVRK